MNSEELELSLRSEFENYLKNVAAEMQQETNEFRSKIEEAFDRHRNHIDEAFKEFSARFDSEHHFDAAFTSSVGEHLRLARDEGAKIAADAMAEAEKLDQEREQEAAKAPAFDALRDAVNDISSKDSQSAILKSLVQHAAEFAPRGAFFIIKNDHFAGWKVFGTDDEAADEAVRDIHFPASADSILGVAARSMSSVEGTAGANPEDSNFLEPLNFGQPERMFAIPLMARGRGVAVLYADFGESGTEINLEALETIVRVAGLTVELQAATHSAKSGMQAATELDSSHDESVSDATPVEEPAAFEETMRETPVEEPSGFAFSESVSFEGGFPQEVDTAQFQAEPVSESPFTSYEVQEAEPETVETESFEYQSYESSEAVSEPAAFEPEPEPFVSESEPVEDEFAQPEPATFDSTETFEAPAFGSSPFEAPAAEYAPVGVPTGGFEPAVEPVIEAPMATPAVPQARLSDRPVDLPIEVPEEERRSHNDARRFARLLVSEIKLYNEKKVLEGREANDLYERLREAIDRSREMYDKRVQPPVAAKFDYFHYELVNSLAEGDAGRLGNGYPGATV